MPKGKVVGPTKKKITPDQLWDLFQQYEKATKANPYKVKDWVGGGGKPVVREKERPLTIEGFNNFVRKTGLAYDIDDYIYNRKEMYNDYIAVSRWIKDSIRQDQIEGGMAGMYSPNITQRLNGLTEKIEESGSKEVKIIVEYADKENNPTETP